MSPNRSTSKPSTYASTVNPKTNWVAADAGRRALRWSSNGFLGMIAWRVEALGSRASLLGTSRIDVLMAQEKKRCAQEGHRDQAFVHRHQEHAYNVQGHRHNRPPVHAPDNPRRNRRRRQMTHSVVPDHQEQQEVRQLNGTENDGEPNLCRIFWAHARHEWG